MFTWHMAGLNMRLMLTVYMKAENACNKLIALKNGKDSVLQGKTSEASFVRFFGAVRDVYFFGLKTHKRYLTAM